MARQRFGILLFAATLACSPLVVGRLHPAGSTPAASAAQSSEGRPEVWIDHEAGQVVRKDAAGRTLWSARLSGPLDGYRPPHLLEDAHRVYLTHGDGVTALDRGTGRVLWHSKGPRDSMCLADGLLLAAECGNGDDVVAGGRWVVARSAATGAECFRVRLPTEEFDAEPIREVAGLFLVQTSEEPGGAGDALLIDRQGRVRHRFGRQVVAGTRLGGDRVFLTSAGMVRLSPEGNVRWSAPFEHPEWPADGDMVELPAGDIVAFLYGCISDSGVQVLRLDAATGVVRWRACCAPLGVDHSKYKHQAAVRLQDGRLEVTSRASRGTFVELLDLQSGRRLRRD